MLRISLLALLIFISGASCLLGQSANQIDFFETHIRPVLAEKCYHCHNSIDTDEAGLAVDYRDGMRSETEHGTVVVPGDPAVSVLMKVIRHEIDDVEMPEDSGKLDDAVIARFEEWIRMGAFDPRDRPPTKEELAHATSWETTLVKRKQWWSLRPLASVKPPALAGIDHPVDRFIRKQLDGHQLEPAPRADRRSLIRRLSYVLTGLPPTVDQIKRFLSDERPDAYEQLVDELLGSERFGERWARHWMDLMRYADSHGSEGDPAIPEIYRYRDYLIRAFNQDVPYDRLLREHIAGDLLDQPRINQQLGINESLIGPAHWRLVFHGFAPTDALDEKVRFTDDQINVFSKAFLGMTVSCARCHDHKFDAISQADYYALFGILASCRPTLRDVNLPEIQTLHREELTELKNSIRSKVANQWLDQMSATQERLLGKDEVWQKKLNEADKPGQLFYLLAEFKRRTEGGAKASEAWQQLSEDWSRYRENVHQDRQRKNAWHWNLSKQADYETWFVDGNGLPESPAPAGDFRIESANRVIATILPSGVHANTISTKHRAFMGSPRFNLDGEYKVWFHVSGGGGAMTRYAVEHYPRDGTVYPIRDINNDRWFWQAYDLKYWQGDYIHLEINTARDAPLRTRNNERSWFGIREVIVREVGAPAPLVDDREFAESLLAETRTPDSHVDVVDVYVAALRRAIVGWRDGELTNAQAVLLNECLLHGLLDNTVDRLSEAASRVERYLALENDIPLPTRVPGLLEADIFNQPLFERGNHRKPTRPIPRRFLEAINDQPFGATQSGRRELAEALLDPANPLTARVMVNRIWHYVFGQGIVSTPDNFGQLGTRPSHPELLDYLAADFQQDWSIQRMIRQLVVSETFRQQSRPTPQAVEVDPDNRWLSHANVRRLDAESIRDTLLSVAGRMNFEMYGPGFNANSDLPRRAVYIRNRRNSLDQFLETFNAPVPFATTGRRNQTNVPAQSLTMLNSPFVMQTAQTWVDRLNDDGLEQDDRIQAMFESSLGRRPTESEHSYLSRYLDGMLDQARTARKRNVELQNDIEETEAQLSRLIMPVRELLLKPNAQGQITSGVAPVAAWNFQTGLVDNVGDLDGQAHGQAEINEGALRVTGGYVSTPPLPWDVEAKTLVATVQLDNLQQQGGGVMTIQTLGGEIFDSIVFGERQAGHWMAGSNYFARTEDFGGPVETSAHEQPVQIAIAYDRDGTIRGYRNGKPYGRAVCKSGLQSFHRGKAHIVFGVRHGDGGGGRLLRGRILDACLYDRALSQEEIAAVAKGSQYVSDRQILAAMSDVTREQVIQLREDVKAMRAELQEPPSEQECWARLGHLLFNLKEFIYVR